MQINNSPDISVLDFGVLFDISNAAPQITITNRSAGAGLANCTWWYSVKTPSQTYIHNGSESVPDRNGAWTTIVVSETWPQPYSKIEFSGSPYVVTLHVKDSEGNIYELEKSQEICRPAGNTNKTIGNFGVASVNMTTLCDKAVLLVNDTTNYVYKGNSGIQHAKTFIVDYPLDDTGNRPSRFTLNDFANASVPIPINGAGYTMFVDSIIDYPFDNGITVRIKYKLKKEFDVYCNINLCPLVCEYQELIAKVESGNCDVNAGMNKEKLAIITAKLNLALVAINQPGCGVDLPRLIEEIKELGGFSCDCCGGTPGNNGVLTGNGINIEVQSTCGDIISTVEQTGDNFKIILKNMKDQIDLTQDMQDAGFSITKNENPSTCTRTWVIDYQAPTGNCPSIGDVVQHADTDLPPAECPNDYFGEDGVEVYDVTNNTVLGIAKNAYELVAILNNNAAYRAFGIAVAVDYCHVAWLCVTGNPPKVPVNPYDPIEPPCVDFIKTFREPIFQLCNISTPMSILDYSFNLYVTYDNGVTKKLVGLVTSYSDMVTKANTAPNLPSNVTIAPSPGTNPLTLDIKVTDTAVPSTCQQTNPLKFQVDRDYIIVYGANHHSSAPGVGGVYAVEMNTQQQMGQICHPSSMADNYPWHLVRVGNKGYHVVTNTGELYIYDLTNPRFPVVLSVTILPAPPSAPFAPFGIEPRYNGSTPSFWDVYAPTDIHAQLHGQYLYFMESVTGCIYKWDTNVDALVAFFYDNRLVGKCPRVVFKDKLYFTMDGFREITTGQSSGVSRRDILIIDLQNFGFPSCISTIQIAAVSDEPWAMSVDPNNAGIAYISTVLGSLIKFNMNTDSIVTNYSGVWNVSGGWAQLLNTVVYNGKVYASSLGRGSKFVDLSLVANPLYTATNFQPLPAPGSPNNPNHYNCLPVTNYCYLLLTYDNGSNPGGIAKYDYDGNFIGLASVTAGDIYNVIPFDGNISGFPNGLCP